jgi:hypothetical protein
MRVLADYHHSSLLRSLVMLFEGRLGMELYRPIGLEWFHRGYWAVSDLKRTAKQFLHLEQLARPGNTGTPRDVAPTGQAGEGIYTVADPGDVSTHRACTLAYFIDTRFDYLIASLPAHVDLFKDLIAKYQPGAKLIVQMGNNWNLAHYRDHNVLASIAPRPAPGVNAIFYHQEFDLNIFAPAPCLPTKKIHSYVNVIQLSGVGWEDHQRLRRLLETDGYEVKAYGGLCPDGNKTGPIELADSMRQAQFVFHVKAGGDGFGHVIHNAYAVGRPLITRSSHYRGQLAERLLVSGTFIDLDREGARKVRRIVTGLTADPERLRHMGQRAAERFRELVDYDAEAGAIAEWLQTLR